VQDVQPNSPAFKAGVKPGDEIIRVNGTDLRTSGRTLQQAIQQMTEKTFPITVLRGEGPPQSPSSAATTPAVPPKEVELQVTPELRDGRKMIGIGIQYPSVHMKLGLTDAFVKSLQSNKDNAVLIFQVIGRLVRREASLKQLDGPVGIVAFSGQAYAAGFATLLTFMALISLNLGVLNILPIPILDGGVILLLIIESVMGRDLSLRMKERIVQASFVFLLMLTVVVLYNDVVKLLPTQSAP
jgi:regulator of sigma E protease